MRVTWCRGTVATRLGTLAIGSLLLFTTLLHQTEEQERWCEDDDGERDPFCIFGDHIYVVTVCHNLTSVTPSLLLLSTRALYPVFIYARVRVLSKATARQLVWEDSSGTPLIFSLV